MNEEGQFEEFESPKKKEFTIDLAQSFGVVIIALIGLQIVGGAVLAPAIYYPETKNLLLPISFLIGGFTAIITFIFWLRISKKEIVESFRILPKGSIFFLSVLLYFSLLPFAELLASLVPTEGMSWLEDYYEVFTEGFEDMMKYKIGGFLAVCIVAPIVEEIIFRGILLRGLLNHGMTPVWAILLSSIIFGAVHLNPWQFVGAGFLGAIFAFVYYKTKSLWLCIFLHALNNGISFFTMIRYGSMEEQVSPTENAYIYIFGGIILAILIVYYINKLTLNDKWN